MFSLLFQNVHIDVIAIAISYYDSNFDKFHEIRRFDALISDRCSF